MDPVINLDKEYGIVLEGGGARGAYQAGVWKALKEGADLDALVSALTAEYAVDEAQARADIKEFLDKLANAGCLEM
jgi:predicted acylesterase/phospholipase RssA